MINRLSISREYLIIIILYSILTIVLTYPMAFHMTDTIGNGDEAFTCWSLIWTTKTIIEDPLHLFQANIFYPANEYSLALSEHLVGWTPITIPIYALTHDPVLTHNFARLLTFILCGFGMYVLCCHYTQNRYAAFIAGIFFAFFAYRLEIQMHLLAMQWVPFMLLFLDRFFHTVRLRDIGAASLFFVLEVLSGWYVGILSLLIGLIFVAGYLIMDGDVRVRVFTRNACLMIIVSLVLVSLILIPFALPYFQASTHYDAERDIDVPIQSSWSLDLFKIVDEFGILFLLLALIGVVIPIMPDKTEDDLKPGLTERIRRQKIPLIFAAIGIISYILALGPVFQINGHLTGILAPYYYLYAMFPFLAIVRDIARFSFSMSFAGSVLTGFGVAAIINRINSENYKKIGAVVLVILTIIVSWHGPVSMPVSLPMGDQIPEEYKWLANQSGDFAIIELPTRWVEDNSEYTYYSVYHWKDMVNGYSGRDVEECSKIMRDTGASFPSNNTISLLQQIGIKYVIIHVDRVKSVLGLSGEDAREFTPLLISTINQSISNEHPNSVRMVCSFNETFIYEIFPEPEVNPDDVLFLLQSGWYGSNSQPGYYLKNTGHINAFSGREGDYQLNFLAEPVYGDKNISLFVNGEEIGTLSAPSGELINGGGIIHLNKGFNDIAFSSTCTRMCDIPELNTLSDKCISFKFTNISASKDNI